MKLCANSSPRLKAGAPLAHLSGVVDDLIELIGNYLSGFDYYDKTGLPATYDPVTDWCVAHEFI